MSTVPVWQSSDAELLTALGELETQSHSTWARMLSVVAEIDSRAMAPGLGYRSTMELVRAIARVPRGEARARLSPAADVLPTRGVNGVPVEPRLPATAVAVADAAIGAADVAVIRSVLARIPAHLGSDTRTEVEAELAHHARTLDASQLAVLGRRILAYLDQDGPHPHDTPQTRRSPRFHDHDGGYALSGWLDREATEILRSALSPLAAPRPTTDTEIDPRTTAQRDADALVELATRALTDGELPTEGGERPQVVVTVTLPVLHGRIGTASLAFGGPINADIARRIACDAGIIPVVLGSRGEPLDIGRASRTVPTAIRRAVILRDGGCAFPGCPVPARWCDIHHIVHWVDNGPTSLANCVALCGRHHRLLHHSHWQITTTNGIPQFHPPPWLGGQSLWPPPSADLPRISPPRHPGPNRTPRHLSTAITSSHDRVLRSISAFQCPAVVGRGPMHRSQTHQEQPNYG